MARNIKKQKSMDYNATKGGVDNLDKLVTGYNCKRIQEADSGAPSARPTEPTTPIPELSVSVSRPDHRELFILCWLGRDSD